jgi:hypothetical protein
MAHIVADRVKDTTTTTGTGTLTLANSAPTGFRTFGSVCSTSDTIWYCIQDAATGAWEVGLGTYTASGTTLARTSILASSNSNAAVSFAAGTKDVWGDHPADRVYVGNPTTTRGDIIFRGATTNDRLAAGTAGQRLQTNGSSADPTWVAAREVLAASRTYYVRADGSDSNTGLSNTSGAAFLTVQKAINVVASLDISIYDVTISIADGTYTGSNTVNGAWIGSGTVTIIGNVVTPANVLIAPVGAPSFLVQNGGRLTVAGMELRGNVSLWSGPYGNISMAGALRFSSTVYQIYANGGLITNGSDYTICASASNHVVVDDRGLIRSVSANVTLTNAPAFAGSFASVGGTGSCLIYYLNTFVYPTITATIASPGVITYTAHGLLANAPIAFATTGALPTGIVAGTTYFVKTVLTANTFTISATAGGAVINTSGSQSGTHTIIATGSKYAVASGGQININAAGINYLPGNAAGTGTNFGVSPYGMYA